ncbi:MAG: hypothetical protein A2883_16700 [Pseudomonadales bacterium RIFCSPHIGHO2_01_FULL_64_12]|uniref:Uncharacterized protein n=1 Tax=Stutzerimonas stutzeri TaxID=316 RepID=A0AA42TDN9_STUST|nr:MULTISPECIES: hypothetical protein [Stutzerimonas]MDH1235392.1 hypothetical protein [Stutzerimonas stutzeri]MDL2173273.1 hypothetical protein [Stutzerimonas sp. FeSN7]OHC21183.1 MAG: hypothetical protein A2883_16700 [Pseudomonadales bacterium RIFCSPHIGHO2_01_FULL_64_12]HLC44399.1 hypothetical protein [Patescibacteria group bacterium]
MDIARALLKAGVTVAAMFAIYQGSQGMQVFAKQRSADANQKAKMQQSEPLERLTTTLRPFDHRKLNGADPAPIALPATKWVCSRRVILYCAIWA